MTLGFPANTKETAGLPTDQPSNQQPRQKPKVSVRKSDPRGDWWIHPLATMQEERSLYPRRKRNKTPRRDECTHAEFHGETSREKRCMSYWEIELDSERAQWSSQSCHRQRDIKHESRNHNSIFLYRARLFFFLSVCLLFKLFWEENLSILSVSLLVQSCSVCSRERHHRENWWSPPCSIRENFVLFYHGCSKQENKVEPSCFVCMADYVAGGLEGIEIYLKSVSLFSLQGFLPKPLDVLILPGYHG